MNEAQNREKTIFEKIIDREIPAQIVYEDEKTLAFMDIAPTAIGHTLVIPKKLSVNIFDIDPENLTALIETVRKIAPAVRDAVGASGVHINSNHGTAAGQEVMHFHFHVIPRHDRSEFTFWPKVDCSSDELQATAQRIRDALSSE